MLRSILYMLIPANIYYTRDYTGWRQSGDTLTQGYTLINISRCEYKDNIYRTLGAGNSIIFFYVTVLFLAEPVIQQVF